MKVVQISLKFDQSSFTNHNHSYPSSVVYSVFNDDIDKGTIKPWSAASLYWLLTILHAWHAYIYIHLTVYVRFLIIWC